MFLLFLRQWQKCHHIWQGFEGDLRSMTSWLVSSETILAHSRLQNGDLDYERAKMHQEVSVLILTEIAVLLCLTFELKSNLMN